MIMRENLVLYRMTSSSPFHDYPRYIDLQPSERSKNMHSGSTLKPHKTTSGQTQVEQKPVCSIPTKKQHNAETRICFVVLVDELINWSHHIHVDCTALVNTQNHEMDESYFFRVYYLCIRHSFPCFYIVWGPLMSSTRRVVQYRVRTIQAVKPG